MTRTKDIAGELRSREKHESLREEQRNYYKLIKYTKQ